jgi:hypothetical protein
MVENWPQYKVVFSYGHKQNREIMSHADIMQKSANKTDN